MFFFVCLRSVTAVKSDCIFFVYIFICVLSVSDRVSFDTTFYCVLSVRDRVSATPTFFWPSLSIEWVVWWPDASCMRRLETSEFFQELVTWGHSLFVPARFKDRIPIHLFLSVVYEYNCGQCAFGQTGNQLKIGISQHEGRSSQLLPLHHLVIFRITPLKLPILFLMIILKS